MAVFGAPIAHEDDAERAVRSALRITQSIAEMNDEQVGLDRAHTSRAAAEGGSAMGHVFDVALTKLAAARCLAGLERYSEAAERATLAERAFDSVRAASLSAEARGLVERAHAVGS